MDPVIILAFQLVRLTGPGGQEIDINPAEIVSIRPKRGDEKYFHNDIECLIHTTDGKFIGVREDCATVLQRLNDLNGD